MQDWGGKERKKVEEGFFLLPHPQHENGFHKSEENVLESQVSHCASDVNINSCGWFVSYFHETPSLQEQKKLKFVQIGLLAPGSL